MKRTTSPSRLVPGPAGAALLIGLLGSCLACTGQISGDPGHEAPPAPDIEPLLVQPEEVIEGKGFCVDKTSGESLVAVSPEGDAWLLSEQSGVSHVRVLDAFAASGQLEAELELTGVERVHAWSQTDAAVITADGLWRVEDLARVQLTPPDGFAEGSAFCGDPGTNGSLLFGGTLYERREDEQWWAYSPGATGKAAPSELLAHQGECRGQDDNTWMTSPDGTLWKVGPAAVYRPLRFDSLDQAVITASASAESQVLIGVVDGEKLWVGPDSWQPWIFASGSPRSLSAAGGALWLNAQGKLLRFNGSWAEVRLPADATGSVDKTLAHDGGVWVETDDSVCHVGAGAMVRVDGIRPFSRSKELDYDFFLSSSDPEASLAASMDGETLLLSVDETTGLSKGKVRLDNVGWHELVISAGSAERRVPVKRLPEQERGWQADIEPIYQAHCSGSECHSSATTPAPKLDSYEAWVALAKKIEGRVVDARSMPPASSRGPDWSEAQVETIAQWLAGGMAP